MRTHVQEPGRLRLQQHQMCGGLVDRYEFEADAHDLPFHVVVAGWEDKEGRVRADG